MAPLAGPQDYPTPESFPEISESQQGGSLTSGLCAFGLIPIILLGAFSWQIRKSKTDE
jgi:hypothetical protein